jgi:hypothetical protein
MGFPVLSYFHKTINDHGSFTFHLLLLSLYIRIVCECFMFTGYDDRELRLKKNSFACVLRLSRVQNSWSANASTLVALSCLVLLPLHSSLTTYWYDRITLLAIKARIAIMYLLFPSPLTHRSRLSSFSRHRASRRRYPASFYSLLLAPQQLILAPEYLRAQLVRLTPPSPVTKTDRQ